MESYNFRGTHWGMARSGVMFTEKNTISISQNDDIIVLQDFVASMEAQIKYEFYEDKLKQTICVFQKNASIETYLQLSRILDGNYGNPLHTTMNAESRSQVELSISMGSLMDKSSSKMRNSYNRMIQRGRILNSVWENADSYISLTFFTLGGHLRLELKYEKK